MLIIKAFASYFYMYQILTSLHDPFGLRQFHASLFV